MKRSYIKAACFIIMAVACNVHAYAHEKDDKPSGMQQKSSSSATTEWYIDGSVKVTGTKTFTISNLTLDYKSLFKKNADLTGGFKSTIISSKTSEVTLSVYAYTSLGASKQPIYYYTSNYGESYYHNTDNNSQTLITLGEKDVFFNGMDIKRLAQAQNIFSPSGCISTEYDYWIQTLNSWDAGSVSGTVFSVDRCADASTSVIIQLTVTNACVSAIKIPGLGEYTPLALFTNDAPTKIVEAYVDGALQNTYSNATDAATNTLSATVGQTITFTAWASGTDADLNNLTVSGFPGTWLARFAGEAMYWCTPSITPEDLRPFLGFDAQIHGTALRRYPEDFVMKENGWSHNIDKTRSWSYIVQREMNPNKDSYTPQAVWNKQHTVNGVTQRRNQREGVNMQLLYSWPASTSSDKGRWNTSYNEDTSFEDPDDADYFSEGIDDDELIYLSNAGDGKTPSELLYSFASTDWKKIQDEETDCSLCDMVTAYKQQQYDMEGRTSKSTYSGHEIEDEGCVKGTDSKGYVNVTDDYKVSANYNFPAGSEVGALKKNNKEPGEATVFGLTIPIDATTPVYTNYGFYGMIEGTQYPSVGEDATYTIKGLNPDKIGNYYVVYDFEDEMGNLYSYKLSTSSTTATNDVYSSKTAYLTNTEMEDDGSENITVKVPVLGIGYNTITVYYKDSYSSEAVIIGGKELMEVQLRFISAYGTNKSFTGSAATDGSSINESKGDGAYIYFEETRDNDDYPNSATDWTTNVLDGWPNQNFVRRYTIPVDQQVTFGALDADPFTFKSYETEWYASSRYIAKRISDDSLSDGQYLKWEVFELSNAYTGLSTSSYAFETGYGKTFSYTFTRAGTYCIRATYRGSSSVSHIIKVVDYSTAADPNTNLTDTVRGSIQIRDITDQELAWLEEWDPDTDFSKYKMAYVTDVLSSYKYSTGYRAYTNDSLKNRFSYFNDYANEYKWVPERTTNSNNPLYDFSGNAQSTYSDTSWFPKIWIRHFSEKSWTYSTTGISDPTGLTNLDDARLDTSSFNTALKDYDVFTKQYANKYEPWQERLPWVALTTYYGSRIRTNIKALYSMSKMFDKDSGALSGNRNDFATSDVYAAYQSNPNFTGMTDDEKDKQKFYYDMLYKRKKLFNPGKTNKLTVYNTDPNSSTSAKTFIATTDLTATDISSDDDSTFIKGVDLSTATNLRNANVKYTNGDESKYDIMTIFKDYGANLVRLRVWVNPVYTSTTNHAIKGNSYSYNNYNDVLKSMNMAKSRGLKVLLTLHLSDKWADPGDQIIPEAWENDFGDFDSDDDVASIPNITNLYNDVYNYVYNLLDSLKTNTGYTPDYIQIGNETNTDILVDNSYAERVELKDSVNLDINWNRQSNLLSAGLSAVKEFNTEKNTSIKTILHTSGVEYLEYFADKYNDYKLNYDVLGVSYYPNISMSSLDKVAEVIDTVYSKYGKPVLIAETGFPRTYDDAASDENTGDEITNKYTSSNYGYGPLTTNYIIQRDWLMQLKTMLKARIATDNNGDTIREALGFVYWEPAWVAKSNSITLEGSYGSGWDNMTFFEPDYSSSTPTYTLETNGGIQVFCNDLFCYNPTYGSSSSNSSTAKTIPGTIVPDSGYNKPADTKQLLFIYPNPATDELHVRINNDDGTYEARIYDMNGRLMLTKHLTQNSILSLSGFTNGIYLLQVHGSAFSETAKIVIHK